jgi:methylenetetrahydrofolate dehydrogenase (NADP+) / methenyltetrahydrofolate cyclohydrolase
VILIDGKASAAKVKIRIKTELDSMALKQKPGLAFILIGQHGPSITYVTMKQKACKELGFSSFLHHLDEKVSEKDLKILIESLNKNPDIHGVLLQQPLPPHLDSLKFLTAIDSEKDVDGFHPINMGKLLTGDMTAFIPCTPKGVLQLLKDYDISVAGKEVVVLGRSNIVGKPMAALLMQKNENGNATVTVCHQRTKNLSEHLKRADILISATGQPNSVGAENLKKGVIAIDVGLSRVEDLSSAKGYRIAGDLKFDEVSKVASYVTPAPGGVGPMTIAMLLENTFISFLKKHS